MKSIKYKFILLSLLFSPLALAISGLNKEAESIDATNRIHELIPMVSVAYTQKYMLNSNSQRLAGVSNCDGTLLAAKYGDYVLIPLECINPTDIYQHKPQKEYEFKISHIDVMLPAEGGKANPNNLKFANLCFGGYLFKGPGLMYEGKDLPNSQVLGLKECNHPHQDTGFMPNNDAVKNYQVKNIYLPPRTKDQNGYLSFPNLAVLELASMPKASKAKLTLTDGFNLNQLENLKIYGWGEDIFGVTLSNALTNQGNLRSVAIKTGSLRNRNLADEHQLPAYGDLSDLGGPLLQETGLNEYKLIGISTRLDKNKASDTHGAIRVLDLTNYAQWLKGILAHTSKLTDGTTVCELKQDCIFN